MGLSTVRDDLHAPCLFKHFTNPSGDQTLHISSDKGGAAPAGINHLPCMIMVQAADGEILHLEDILGNISSTTFALTSADDLVFPVRCSPAVLGDETTCSVTVFWNPEP